MWAVGLVYLFGRMSFFKFGDKITFVSTFIGDGNVLGETLQCANNDHTLGKIQTRSNWFQFPTQGFYVNIVHILKKVTWITKSNTLGGSWFRTVREVGKCISLVFVCNCLFILEFHLKLFTRITVSSRQEGSWGLTGETVGRLPACAQWRQPLQPWHWPPI